MIMMGMKFMGDVPFREVYIHALVRDAEGKKMSKSKGNVIDPLVVIDQFGTDAFRFSLAMLAAQGRDILLSEERIEGVRNFANKIWNASKLSLSFIGESYDEQTNEKPSFLPDQWIRSRAQKMVRGVAESIEAYRFNEAASIMYNFIWREYCDWYLELIKPNLYGKVTTFSPEATRATLYRTLSDILKTLHPLMPFISEEIFQRLPGNNGESIMNTSFPEVNNSEVDEEAENKMDILMGVVDVVRNIRGETGIGPNVRVEVVIRTNNHISLLQEYEYYIKGLAKIEHLSFVDGAAPEQSAVGVYREIEIFVPLKDLIDITKELSRIDKELKKIEDDCVKLIQKLNNPAFREKAPQEVIEKNNANYEEFQGKREKLLASKKLLENLSGN
jgi:valyl-tRNA synthetase